MAKKKNVKSKDKNTFNISIRKFSKEMIKRFVTDNKEVYSDEDLNKVSQYIIDNIENTDKIDFVKDCDRAVFSQIINSFIDIRMAYNLTGDFSKYFTEIRDILVRELASTNNIGELLVLASSNSYTEIYDCLRKNNDKNINIECLKKTMTDITTFALHCLTFITKLKNNKINAIEFQNDKFTIEYTKETLFSKRELEFSNDLKNIGSYDCAEMFLYLSMDINEALVNYRNKSNTCVDGNKLNVYELFMLNENIIMPFFKEHDEFDFNFEGLSCLPDNRRYGIFSEGIRFDFKDKSEGINYVDMKETMEEIFFTVSLVNFKEMYYLSKRNYIRLIRENAYRGETEYYGNIINFDKKHFNPIENYNIKFRVNKELLKEAKTFDSMVKLLNIENVNINTTNKFSSKGVVNLAVIVFTCMYISYYDLKLFADAFTFKRIQNEKLKGTSKTDTYRVSHLRKLPSGFKRSEDAEVLARKAGFTNIPDGYTFVEEHIPFNDMQDKKKIIKI